jgi:hypothetical protein
VVVRAFFDTDSGHADGGVTGGVLGPALLREACAGRMRLDGAVRRDERRRGMRAVRVRGDV